MRKVNFKKLFIRISIILFVLVSCIRFYIDNLIMSNLALIMMFGAVALLLLNILSEKKLRIVNKKYFIVAILLFLPSLYKNAYISDHIYTYFLYYFLTIIYSILLCFSSIDKDDIEFSLKLYTIFAVATGVVTWISLFSPNFYVQKIIPLMPSNLHYELKLNFLKLNSRMGLTSHYSRNAFYLILGILSSLYFIFEKNKKSSKILLIFFVTTMLIVGKRGHFIFLVISIILSYFIYYRVSFKSILRFILIMILAIVVMGMIVKVVPEAQNTFNRIFNDNSNDVSSGRFDMYKDIWRMYKQNNYIGIGWNKYASNTGYVHPGVHNDYIQILCESGIIGFLIIIGSNIYILKYAIKYARKSKTAISKIILIYNIFFMFYSLTGIPHYDVETYMYYFLINSILFYISVREINCNKVEMYKHIGGKNE